jgi:hypothetical protein
LTNTRLHMYTYTLTFSARNLMFASRVSNVHEHSSVNCK